MKGRNKKIKETQTPVSKYVSLRVKSVKREKPGIFVVIPKSFSKKATDRNLFRRRIKSILRSSKRSNLIKNKSLTFFLKKEAKKISFSELKKETEKLLSRV